MSHTLPDNHLASACFCQVCPAVKPSHTKLPFRKIILNSHYPHQNCQILWSIIKIYEAHLWSFDSSLFILWYILDMFQYVSIVSGSLIFACLPLQCPMFASQVLALRSQFQCTAEAACCEDSSPAFCRNAWNTQPEPGLKMYDMLVKTETSWNVVMHGIPFCCFVVPFEHAAWKFWNFNCNEFHSHLRQSGVWNFPQSLPWSQPQQWQPVAKKQGTSPVATNARPQRVLQAPPSVSAMHCDIQAVKQILQWCFVVIVCGVVICDKRSCNVHIKSVASFTSCYFFQLNLSVFNLKRLNCADSGFIAFLVLEPFNILFNQGQTHQAHLNISILHILDFV